MKGFDPTQLKVGCVCQSVSISLEFYATSISHHLTFSFVYIVVLLDLETILIQPRITKAKQKVLALIAQLGKLDRFEEAADFFMFMNVYYNQITEWIRANTICPAVNLLGLANVANQLHLQSTAYMQLF